MSAGGKRGILEWDERDEWDECVAWDRSELWTGALFVSVIWWLDGMESGRVMNLGEGKEVRPFFISLSFRDEIRRIDVLASIDGGHFVSNNPRQIAAYTRSLGFLNTTFGISAAIMHSHITHRSWQTVFGSDHPFHRIFFQNGLMHRTPFHRVLITSMMINQNVHFVSRCFSLNGALDRTHSLNVPILCGRACVLRLREWIHCWEERNSFFFETEDLDFAWC